MSDDAEVARAPAIADIKVRMTADERKLLERLLSNSRRYLEFGSGGSTELAVALGCRKILSVESSADWVAALSEKPLIREALERQQLIFELVSIGPVRDWGFPKNSASVKKWPNYYLSPFQNYQIPFDFILIDGRFRKACAYASWAYMSDDTVVAIHDYTQRDSLSEIEKFFNVEECVDSLVVLSKKQKVLPRTFFTAAIRDMLEPW